MSSLALASWTPRLHDPEAAQRGVRLKTLCEMYCRSRPQISRGAVQQYHVAANLARRWLLSRRKRTFLDEIFELDRFLEFAAWLAQGRSPATINGRIDSLWMLWRFAQKKDLANARPDSDEKPRWRELRTDPGAYTMPEIIRLLAFAERARPMRRLGWWTGDFWQTLIATFLSTAERFEAMMLCPRSALRGNVLMVPAALTKDGKEQPIVLPDWVAEKIRRLPQIEGSPLIWTYPFQLKQLAVRYAKDVLGPAGLPTTRRDKFHKLRRTALTQVFIAHGPRAAQMMARHFSSGLTWQKYISPSVVAQQTGSVSFEVPAPPPTVNSV